MFPKAPMSQKAYRGTNLAAITKFPVFSFFGLTIKLEPSYHVAPPLEWRT